MIADAGGRLHPIEIRLGQTLNRDFFIGLERWLALAGSQAASPVLIYGGAEDRVHRAVRVLPWNRIHTVFEFGTVCLDLREEVYIGIGYYTGGVLGTSGLLQKF